MILLLNLQNEALIHQFINNRPYMCEHCSKGFVTLLYYQHHFKLVHSFQCEEKYAIKYDLRYDVRVIHDKVPEQ